MIYNIFYEIVIFKGCFKLKNTIVSNIHLNIQYIHIKMYILNVFFIVINMTKLERAWLCNFIDQSQNGNSQVDSTPLSLQMFKIVCPWGSIKIILSEGI